jgi:hypothetical protein
MNELNEKALIIALEEKLASAHLILDVEAISELLHDDYLILQPGGVIETKQMVLNSIKGGEREWQAANVTDLHVDIYDAMARVTGVWKAKGKIKKKNSLTRHVSFRYGLMKGMGGKYRLFFLGNNVALSFLDHPIDRTYILYYNKMRIIRLSVFQEGIDEPLHSF